MVRYVWLSGIGGDQRPLIPPEGRDLCYASLVFEALWQDTSPAGRQFAKESEELYLYWRRLVKGITSYNRVRRDLANEKQKTRITNLTNLMLIDLSAMASFPPWTGDRIQEKNRGGSSTIWQNLKHLNVGSIGR